MTFMQTPPSPTPDTPVPGEPASQAVPPPSRRAAWVMPVVVLVLGLAVAYLWQKLDHIQSQLARTSTEAATFSMEARATAKAAQDLSRETATRLGVAESKLSEVSLQRSQLEELMQSLSRSRDENLVVDMDAAIRLAQQQSQMLGSSEPLLAALKAAEQRITRASQPRLAPVMRAIAKDMDKLKAARVLDIGNASLSLDEVSRMVDELPLAQDIVRVAPSTPKAATQSAVTTVMGWGDRFWQEVKSLVRVSRIDTPEAALLSPSQSYFARENLKLRLLNARIGLLSRQLNSAASDLKATQQTLSRFFDPNAKAVQLARDRVQQVQSQLQNADLPRVDDTLTALSTAATGK
jgi:uroporphyrin-III C-methyltransferase